MQLKKPITILYPAVLLFVVFAVFSNCKKKPVKTYEPTLESLASHPVPQWFRDAKFGIFIHWGVYAVPAYHEWYIVYMSPNSSFGRNLGGPPYNAVQGDLPDSVFYANTHKEAVNYHSDNYGADFEYDEFIPMFKAERYDPGAWADLFRKAGARYVVLTPKHGDEFALWPSKYTERNSMQAGPHRDLVGDLTKEVRLHGMKMGFYHNTTYSFWDERYPDKEWVEYMNNSIKELVDLYKPDILWGDVPVGPVRDENGKPLGADHWNSKEVIAYFYNNSENPDEVVTNDRWDLDMIDAGIDSERSLSKSLWAQRAGSWNVKDGVFLGDFQTPERRNITGIYEMPWETCDALDPTSWGYNRRLPDEKYLTANELVDYLADIVSKGGNLLINIGPKADGTIPEVMQKCLEETGDWLSVNGEAIFETRPWKVFGEGPTLEETGFSSRDRYRFKAGDVRFTRKGNTLYVIMLEWPVNGEIVLSSLKGTKVSKISMPGSKENIRWNQTEEGLSITLPAGQGSPHANVMKLKCKNL